MPRDKENGVSNVNFMDKNFYDHLNDPEHENHEMIKRFLGHLAVCHTVIIDDDGKGHVEFNASSPDELALVNGALHLGYKFTDRDGENNIKI